MIEDALISRPVVSRKGIFFWLLRCLAKVRYTFFLTTIVLGWRIGSVLGVAIWIVVSFAVVLLHELGHALAARWYGQNPEIEGAIGFVACPPPAHIPGSALRDPRLRQLPADARAAGVPLPGVTSDRVKAPMTALAPRHLA